MSRSSKPEKPTEAIIALPRRERRQIWRDAVRGIPSLDEKGKPVRLSTDWEDYRRWDGGKPNILRSRDLLKVKESRKVRAAGPTISPAADPNSQAAADQEFVLHVAGAIGALKASGIRVRQRTGVAS